MLSREALEALVAVARENDLWIVSDEAYEDVIYEPYAHHSVAAVAGDWANRVISVFSFSKSHAMAGLRVGYVVTRSAMLQERIQKLLRCTINGVNSLAQWAALAAVTGPQEHLDAMRDEYTVRRDSCSLRSTASRASAPSHRAAHSTSGLRSTRPSINVSP